MKTIAFFIFAALVVVHVSSAESSSDEACKSLKAVMVEAAKATYGKQTNVDEVDQLLKKAADLASSCRTPNVKAQYIEAKKEILQKRNGETTSVLPVKVKADSKSASHSNY